jgi:ABC-type antimicrobial peptide transport system permease subunit
MLSLRPFNLISGKEFQVTDLVTPVFIGGMLLITLFTGIVAGIYPSFVLSGFKPMNTLKGTSGTGNKGGMFRKITVTIQYALSILLIAGTIIIYRQLDFMQSQKLGYDKENLLYIPLRGDLKNSYPVIKEELLRNPVVKSITASTHPPQNIGSNSSGASWEGKPTDMDVLISMSGVDFDYVETMGIEMKSGRTFSRSYAEDSPRDSLGSFLINEQMEKLMGMQNVIGARLQFGHTGPVIGVMRDFNFHSLHNKIEPLAISIWGGNFLNFMYIRINPGNLPAAMKQLENAWNRILPLFPFDYHFVSDDFDKTYRTEERMGTLMNYFAVMAILIACIGLFGLAAFTVEQKTREVGIRKALGATSLNIFVLFAKEFMQLLVIAIGISLPAAWFLFSRFLQNYSYHTQLDGWIFIISALTAMAVALTAISYQIFRAIRTNPAETLKFE